MSELLRFETGSGHVVVEVAEDEPGIRLASRDGVVGEAPAHLENALESVRGAAESTLRVFRDGLLRPDGIEVEFGVRLNAEAGAVIAKSTVEGHFVVKLSWQRAPSGAE